MHLSLLQRMWGLKKLYWILDTFHKFCLSLTVGKKKLCQILKWTNNFLIDFSEMDLKFNLNINFYPSIGWILPLLEDFITIIQ